MSKANDEADALYRAIGRFIVEYSRLDGRMRNLMDHLVLIHRGGGVVAIPWMAALGQITTSDKMSAVFFSVCSAMRELEPDEIAIQAALRAQIKALRKKRTHVAHDVWQVGSDTSAASSIRLGFSGGHDTIHVRFRNPPDIEALADEAVELAELVHAFAEGCASQGAGVADRLELAGGRVVRKSATP